VVRRGVNGERCMGRVKGDTEQRGIMGPIKINGIKDTCTAVFI